VPSASERLLLLACVTNGVRARAAWHEWFSAVVVDDLPYREARLLPRAFENLSRQGLATGLPPRLRGNYRFVWASNQLRCRAVAPALVELAHAGVPALLLKGAAFLASGSFAWGTREMGDVDILVPADRARDAARILERIGWAGMLGVTPDFLARRIVLRRNSWNLERHDPHERLDLHWHAFEGLRGRALDASLWRAARPVRFGEVDLVRLDDRDQLLHLVEHASHGEPANGLVWIADAALLVESVDVTRLAARARELGVHALAREALGVVADVVDSASARAAVAALQRRRPSLRERALARTEFEPGKVHPFPRASEVVRTLLVHGLERHPLRALSTLRRRRIEPDLCSHPVGSTALALIGRPRRVEAAALRAFGPLARPPVGGRLGVGQWVELTTGDALDRVAGAGWTWPTAEGIWSDGAEPRFALDVELPRGRPLELEFQFGDDAHHSPNPRVMLLVNARPVLTWTFGVGPEHAPTEVRIPAWLADWCRPLDIAFRPMRPFQSGSRLGPGDVQRAVQLRAVRVTASAP